MQNEDESSDSTYVGEETSEETETPAQHEEKEKLLSATELDELWQQLHQVDDSKRQRDEYLNKKEEVLSTSFCLSGVTTLPDDIFADYAIQKNSDENKDYLQSLKKYAPKLITIHETKKFWQMYKSTLSPDQVQVLQRYVESRQGFIERQRFLHDKKASK